MTVLKSFGDIWGQSSDWVVCPLSCPSVKKLFQLTRSCEESLLWNSFCFLLKLPPFIPRICTIMKGHHIWLLVSFTPRCMEFPRDDVSHCDRVWQSYSVVLSVLHSAYMQTILWNNRLIRWRLTWVNLCRKESAEAEYMSWKWVHF